MAKKGTSLRGIRSSKIKREELPKDMTNMSEDDKLKVGVALFGQGTYIEAIEAFSRVTGECYLQARQYLARCYYRMGQYETAYMHFSYLVEHGDDMLRDYGASMVAAIDMMWGNYGNAIKQLRSLPENPRNLVNLALAFWKKYQIQKEEFSMWESMRLLKKINVEYVAPINKHIMFHLMALIYQSQKEYHLAERYYQKALQIDVSLCNTGLVLNDYASLHIHQANFEEAYSILMKARELVEGKHDVAEAYNNKWLGVLASIQNKHVEAGQYLQKAAKIIHEKDLFIELANIFYILADSMKNKDFHKAAEYFADAMNYEKLSEEVKERDEKIVMFYYGGFYGINGDTSGIG